MVTQIGHTGQILSSLTPGANLLTILNHHRRERTVSLRDVEQFAQELPHVIADDVVLYARSVRDALPDIFREANVEPSERISDQVVFIAGVKRLEAICSSNLWTLDNALSNLAKAHSDSVGRIEVRIGSLSVSRNSEYYQNLATLNRGLQLLLQRLEISDLVAMNRYVDIVKELHGRR